MLICHNYEGSLIFRRVVPGLMVHRGGGSSDFRLAGPGANCPHLGLSGSAQRVFDHISIFCHILNICPPYWIRHFVFTHFAYVPVISDIGSPQIPIFDNICHIGSAILFFHILLTYL